MNLNEKDLLNNKIQNLEEDCWRLTNEVSAWKRMAREIAHELHAQGVEQLEDPEIAKRVILRQVRWNAEERADLTDPILLSDIARQIDEQCPDCDQGYVPAFDNDGNEIGEQCPLVAGCSIRRQGSA